MLVERVFRGAREQLVAAVGQALALLILASRDRLQVVRGDAVAAAAQVIEREALVHAAAKRTRLCRMTSS